MNLTVRTLIETEEDNVIMQLDLSGDWSLNPIHGWGTPNSDIADLNSFGIAVTQLQTFLVASSHTCKDVAGNHLRAIPLVEKLGMVGKP